MGRRSERVDEGRVTAYPKFAIAWFELGVLRQGRNDLPGAEEAWREALKSDPKYVKPYEVLAALAERQQKWEESENYSREWIQLDPEDFLRRHIFITRSLNARLE